MIKSKPVLFVAMIAGAALLSTPQVTSAQEKLTYKQAFTKCKQELDSAGVPGVNTNAVARQSAGGACMNKYGFRLKKKAKF
jgi:hypothetical protein